MSPQTAGRLRRVLSRLTTPTEQLEARELQADCAGVGATPVSDVDDRTRATVAGVLRTVTLRPRAGVPALEAELYDGSGSVSLVWLGRRQIPGIESGRSLVAHGFLTRGPRGCVMFNPRYELRPAAHE